MASTVGINWKISEDQVADDGPSSFKEEEDLVSRFIGTSLISNRVSNGRGATRLFSMPHGALLASPRNPHSIPHVASLPAYMYQQNYAPLLTTVTGAPLISWKRSGGSLHGWQQQHVSGCCKLNCSCPANQPMPVPTSRDLAAMGVGLIAVDPYSGCPVLQSEHHHQPCLSTSFSAGTFEGGQNSASEKKKLKMTTTSDVNSETEQPGAPAQSQSSQQPVCVSGCGCSDCKQVVIQEARLNQQATQSYCYLSLKRSEQNRLLRQKKLRSAPLITISVPPNCRIIRDDDSMKLSTTRCSSVGSADSCSTSGGRIDDDEVASLISELASSPDSPNSASSLDSAQSEDVAGYVFPMEYCGLVHTPPPPERQWIMTNRIDRERPIATLTALCYNVLCDKYATSSLYSYCPTWALNWEYRKKYIMQEIKHYEADILTLQEVEGGQFENLFLPELEQVGYTGVFSPKSRAKTMNEDERKYVDGCAILWKVDKFELDGGEHLIEFNKLAIAKADGSEEMINRVMTRDNIALSVVLKIKEPIYTNGVLPANPSENVAGTPIVVSTAHIHWDPEFCDVKLVQSMMLVQELSKILQEVGQRYRLNSHQIPLILCGDLNSLPNSGVFEFLAKGRLSADHTDLKGFRGQTCLQKLSSGHDLSLYTHPLKIDSAYDTSTLPFTNYTLDFKGMIDYIFHTPSSLYKLGVLGPIEPLWLQQNKIIGYPHPHIPSDHIPLVSQYAVIPPYHQQHRSAPGPGGPLAAFNSQGGHGHGPHAGPPQPPAQSGYQHFHGQFGPFGR